MFAPLASLASYETKGSDSTYAVPIAIIPISRSPSPKPTTARARRTLVRGRSFSNSSSPHVAVVSPVPSYGRIYNETTLSESYKDAMAPLPQRSQTRHSPQPFQRQTRRISMEPLRRSVHSPYSAVRRSANVNCNRDQHLDKQMAEIVQTNKVSFREKRKKALCIGINYKGQDKELRGCVNDAWNISEFLKSFWNYAQGDIMVLTDELYLNPKYMPTKRNILNALQWLVKDAQPGDCLFFHFSGHGGRMDLDGRRMDHHGSEKAIHPVDWESAGAIVSEVLYDIMVKPLPTGCCLTALFDSCHSGTVLDLPYIYQADGRLKSHATTLTKYPRAHVVLFAACSDLQGSGGIIVRGREFLGAMSAAFTHSLTANSTQTYLQVLTSVKGILRRTQKQTPQLSSSYPIDANRRCLL